MIFISKQNAYLVRVKVVRHSLKKLDVTHTPMRSFFLLLVFSPLSICMLKRSISFVFIIVIISCILKPISIMSLKQFSLTDNQFGRFNRWFSTIFRWPLLLLLLPWVLYFILDLVTTVFIWDVDLEFGIPVLHAVFGLKVLIVFFYFSFDYIVLRRKFFSGGVYTVVIIGVITTVKYMLITSIDPLYSVDRLVIANEIMRLFHFMGFSFFIWMCYRYYLSVQYKLKVKVELAELQLAHISLQLSPHFTMNVLNDLLAKVILVSRPMFFTLSRMSRILKYHYFSPGAANLLTDELGVVRDYLELQHQRFNFPMHLSLNTNTVEKGLYIPKKLLLTLVENIFKHGATDDKLAPVIISSSTKYDLQGRPSFSFSIINKIRTHTISSTGFGLKAVRYLLESYFPGRNFIFQSNSSGEHSLFLVISYDTLQVKNLGTGI